MSINSDLCCFSYIAGESAYSGSGPAKEPSTGGATRQATPLSHAHLFHFFIFIIIIISSSSRSF